MRDIRDHRDKLYLNTFKVVREALKDWESYTNEQRQYVMDLIDQAIKRLEERPV